MREDSRIACRMEVFGTVQGVGFRPFVHPATGLGLDGWVCNVVVAAAGRADALDAFAERLRRDAPPLAAVRPARAVVLLTSRAVRTGSGPAAAAAPAATGTGAAAGVHPGKSA